MIITVARVRTDPQRRAELVRIGQRVAEASRQEPGCLHYRIYQDSEDENAYVFVEEWVSEEALQAHFATPHVAEFMAVIQATLVGPPDVKFHTVASTVDLADVTGS